MKFTMPKEWDKLVLFSFCKWNFFLYYWNDFIVNDTAINDILLSTLLTVVAFISYAMTFFREFLTTSYKIALIIFAISVCLSVSM
jgi:hypothetical protein